MKPCGRDQLVHPCGLLIGENAVTANPNSEAGRAVFATTHWSVVVEAGLNNSPQAFEAMTELCRAYWYPLYAHVRRKGYPAPDAQDLTQEFFARLLARNYPTVADRQKGKFRSFLLGTFEHFLAKEWRRGVTGREKSGDRRPKTISRRPGLRTAMKGLGTRKQSKVQAQLSIAGI